MKDMNNPGNNRGPNTPNLIPFPEGAMQYKKLYHYYQHH